MEETGKGTVTLNPSAGIGRSRLQIASPFTATFE